MPSGPWDRGLEAWSHGLGAWTLVPLFGPEPVVPLKRVPGPFIWGVQPYYSPVWLWLWDDLRHLAVAHLACPFGTGLFG